MIFSDESIIPKTCETKILKTAYCTYVPNNDTSKPCTYYGKYCISNDNANVSIYGGSEGSKKQNIHVDDSGEDKRKSFFQIKNNTETKSIEDQASVKLDQNIQSKAKSKAHVERRRYEEDVIETCNIM